MSFIKDSKVGNYLVKIGWLRTLLSKYQRRYLGMHLLLYPVSLVLGFILMMLGRWVIAVLLPGKGYDDITGFFVRLYDALTKDKAVPSTGELIRDGGTLLAVSVFSLFLAWIITWWWKRKIVLRTFKPLGTLVSRLRNQVVENCTKLLRASVQKEGVWAYDPLLTHERLDFEVALHSTIAFLGMRVDPDSIERCVKRLHDELINGSRVPKKIVACASLTPKEWSNPITMSYLLATLALYVKASRSGTTVNATRFYIVPSYLEDKDNKIMDDLKVIHKAMGFTLRVLEMPDAHSYPSELDPVIQYQRIRYPGHEPDPAFLFVEFEYCSLFYRIVYNGLGVPYIKAWEQEEWRAPDKSVEAYQKAIVAMQQAIL